MYEGVFNDTKKLPDICATLMKNLEVYGAFWKKTALHRFLINKYEPSIG